MSRSAHLREPHLSGFPPVDAALCLPALGRNRSRAGGPVASLGKAEPATRVSDAARRRTLDIASYDAALRPEDIEDEMPKTPLSFPKSALRSAAIVSCCRFARDEQGATAIEYALIAAGIAVAIATTVSLVGS